MSVTYGGGSFEFATVSEYFQKPPRCIALGNDRAKYTPTFDFENEKLRSPPARGRNGNEIVSIKRIVG